MRVPENLPPISTPLSQMNENTVADTDTTSSVATLLFRRENGIGPVRAQRALRTLLRNSASSPLSPRGTSPKFAVLCSQQEPAPVDPNAPPPRLRRISSRFPLSLENLPPSDREVATPEPQSAPPLQELPSTPDNP